MFTRVNDLTLHYQLEGNPAGRMLICLNSLGCSLVMWDELVRLLGGAYRFLRYDLRGQGFSDGAPSTGRLQDYTQDLALLLDALGLRDGILIGNSFGGMIAMDFALRYPEKARALALLDTAPKIGTAEFWEERMHAVREFGLGVMSETILRRWFCPGFRNERPAEYQGYHNMLARASQAGYLAACEALRDADLSERIQEIRLPVLAVCGAEDLVVTAEATRNWAARIAKARLEIIPGAAHLPGVEQPERVAAALDQFLKDINHDR